VAGDEGSLALFGKGGGEAVGISDAAFGFELGGDLCEFHVDIDDLDTHFVQSGFACRAATSAEEDGLAAGAGGRGAEEREASCPGSSGGGGFRGRLRGMP